MIFPARLTAGFKKRKAKSQRIDIVSEQVKEILQDTDQKIILMVRG